MRRMKAYTRTSPSPRYQRLLALYREMHREGEVQLGIPPDQTFPGKSLPPQAGHIKRLIDATGAKTVLDYGCGKGNQYLPMPWKDEGGTVHLGIAAWWDVEVRCYDPGYPKFAELPDGQVRRRDLDRRARALPGGGHALDRGGAVRLRDARSCSRTSRASRRASTCRTVRTRTARSGRSNGGGSSWRDRARAPGVRYEFRLQLDERGPQGAMARVEKMLTNRDTSGRLSSVAA